MTKGLSTKYQECTRAAHRVARVSVFTKSTLDFFNLYLLVCVPYVARKPLVRQLERMESDRSGDWRAIGELLGGRLFDFEERFGKKAEEKTLVPVERLDMTQQHHIQCRKTLALRFESGELHRSRRKVDVRLGKRIPELNHLFLSHVGDL